MKSYESAFWSLQAIIEDARGARETNLEGNPPRLENSVRLNNVSFGYGKISVLGNASLTVPAGSFTAITGPSGAGKTTLAGLIISLIRPQQGQILIDNVSLEEVDLRQWRRMIGYVPQETLLLHETVLWNVTLGDPEVNETDVEAARRAKLLILDEVTSSLDPETEAAICRTLQGLRGRLTILAISHQPAVVEAA